MRSWRREANKISKLVKEYSNPNFAIGVGNHGEPFADIIKRDLGLSVDAPVSIADGTLNRLVGTARENYC